MPLQRATLCLASPGEARRQHSQFESISQPSQIPSCSLQFSPTSPISEACMECLERFVIFMYDRAGNKTSVDETRKAMFVQKGRAYDAIPPTRAALLKHTNRAAYQAGPLLGPSAYTMPRSPFTRGLRMDFERGRMAAFLDDASRCDQVVQKSYFAVGAKRGCRGGCSCTRATLKCTAL